MKRVLSLAIALVMILSMMPNVFAVESNEDQLPSDAGTLGTEANPQVLTELGYVDLTLAAGDADGYYYSYTAEGNGTLTVYISSIAAVPTDDNELPVVPASVSEETITGDIVLTNKTTGVVKTLSKDGVDNYGLELTVEVAADDVILIQVTASAAAELTWYANFAYPQGSEQNPIYPEWTWNEDWTEATATVTAPVGTTYYAVYANGMILTINGEEYGVLTAAGMGRVPAIFTITNDGEAAAEYSLKISYPVGNMNNPAQLVIGENTANIVADSWGYYYAWTATEAGTLSIEMPYDSDWFYVINNMTTYVYGDNHYSDDENGAVYSESVEVAAGDEIQVIVNTLDNTAGELTFYASFVGVPGTENNPIYPEWTWNEDWTEATATVTAPVGTTYYAVYANGMILTVNGEDQGVLTAAGIGRVPCIFTITNDGEAPAEYSLKISYPVGNMSNPAQLVIGENTANIMADSWGYYYTWTATEAGTLTIEMPADQSWFYVINNMTTYVYGDNHYSDDKVVVSSESIEVAAGDEIQVIVNTLDNTAGTLTFQASFTAKEEGGEETTVQGDVNGDGIVDSYDAYLIAEYDVGNIDASKLDLTACDVSGDGIVDSYDAYLIAEYDVGNITEFPAK